MITTPKTFPSPPASAIPVDYHWIYGLCIMYPLVAEVGSNLVWQFDAAGRITLSLILIGWLYFAQQLPKEKRNGMLHPLLPLALLCAYTLANVVFKGFTASSLWLFGSIQLQYVLYIAMTAYAGIINFRKTLYFIALGLFVNILFFLFYGQIILFGSDAFARLGGDALNANFIGRTGAFYLTAIAMLYLNRSLSKSAFWMGCALGLYITMLSGSRNAALMFVGLLAAVLFELLKKSSTAKKLQTACVIGAIGTASVCVFVQSVAFQRFQAFGQEINFLYAIAGVDENSLEGKIISLLGDRGLYYVISYDVWRLAPLTGVGRGNYGQFNEFGLSCHVEYIGQFCEGGIIGGLLFIWFVYALIKSVYVLPKSFVRIKQPGYYLIFAFCLMFVLLNFVSHTHTRIELGAMLGIVLAYVARVRLADGCDEKNVEKINSLTY